MASFSSRVVTIHNRKTSMRLAKAEWDAINTICERENIKRKKLFELIESNRDEKMGLTTSIRLFSIIYYRYSIARPYSNKQKQPNPIFEAIKGIV